MDLTQMFNFEFRAARSWSGQFCYLWIVTIFTGVQKSETCLTLSSGVISVVRRIHSDSCYILTQCAHV